MSVDTKERIKQEIKEKFNERIVVKRLIYYIFDYKTRNSVLYQDTTLENEWSNPDTKELYTLKDVAFYYDGIPVYIVLKGINFSVGFDFVGDPYIDKDGKEYYLYDLVQKGYSPEDMEAVLTSQTTNRLFRTIRKLDTSMLLAIGFLNILSVVITVLVYQTIIPIIYW